MRAPLATKCYHHDVTSIARTKVLLHLRLKRFGQSVLRKGGEIVVGGAPFSRRERIGHG
jgi:hypothetical protein